MSGYRLQPNEFSGYGERQKPYAEPPRPKAGEFTTQPRGVPRGSEIVPFDSPANPNRPILNPFDPRVRNAPSPLAQPARRLLDDLPGYPGRPLVRRLPIPLPLKLLPELLPFVGLIPELAKALRPKENPSTQPLKTAPPPWSGGQVAGVQYSLQLSLTVEFRNCSAGGLYATNTYTFGQSVYGPIERFEWVYTTTNDANCPNNEVRIDIVGRTSTGALFTQFNRFTWAGTLRYCNVISVNYHRVQRSDGLPDTGGNPQEQPIKYPVYPYSFFLPPSPTTPRPPEKPKLTFEFPTGNPYRPPINPETGTEDPPGQLVPSPNKLPVKTPVPDYTQSPPPRVPPTRPDEGEECNDPCNSFTWDLLDFIIDQLQAREEPQEECPELFDLYLPYTVCTEDGPEIKQAYIQAAFWLPHDIRDVFAESARLASLGCDPVEAVAAVPEWWAVRPGSDRPQLVYVYRVQGGKTYHEIAVPHPEDTTKTSVPVVPDYRKGNWMARVRMVDNTNITVYGETAGEAERVARALSGLVRHEMVTQPLDITVFERRGTPVGVASMKCSAIMYYPVGRKAQAPEWRTRVLTPY